MAVVTINKSIDIPNVSQVSGTPISIGSKRRTPLGNLIVQKAARKREWTFRANKITKDEFDAFNDHLDSILGGKTYFWIDEFGGNAENDSILALIELKPWDRVQFGRDGAWHKDGRNIEFTVEEA